MSQKIGFIGSGHGGLAAFKSLQRNFDSIEVLSADKDVLTRMRSQDQMCLSIDLMKSHILVCAGYKEIISEDVLRKKTIINAHPSLLPKYRGLHSLVWAMLNFEKELGLTIHLMNEKIDDGDILQQFKITYEDQTSKHIMDIFDDYIEKNLGRVVQEYIQGKIKAIPQDMNHATWCSRRNLSDCIIDFNSENRFIHIFFKALVRPYPLPMIKYKNKIYEVDGYKLLENHYYMHIGRVVNIDQEGVYIKTKEGIFIIDKLIDLEDKKNIKASSIFRIGSRL